MLISQEIYEGLKQAISKGDSLNNAMITFENAGYPKDEINEAARLLQSDYPLEQPQITPPVIVQPQVIDSSNQFPIQKPQVIQKVSQYGNIPQPQQQIIKTPISNYSPPEVKGSFLESNTLVIILSIMLFLLCSLLVALFLFKDAVIGFFNNLFV